MRDRPPSDVALITGASRGIGRAAALRLAADGLDIAINFRSSLREAEDVVSAVQACGRRAVALQADVAVAAEAASLVTRAEKELGPLSVLVNNAGITKDRLLIQMSEEDWDSTWLTDLAGARAAAQQAVELMSERGYGRVVNVSSVVGSTGNAGQANYAAAKAAIVGLTRQLSVQASPCGVTVNCVIPGYIETDATSHLTDKQTDAWLSRIPSFRLGTVEEVASVIAFLAAENSAYVTGQCIAVDGGLLAKAGWGFSS